MDVTTEAYPYTAASTSLESTMFDDGWQGRLGIGFGELQWVATGERLTAESFARYRKQGGAVIMHLMKPEWIRQAMASPFVMIASDGMPYSPGAHPRSAGTFSRVLGVYVREEKVLSLMDALSEDDTNAGAAIGDSRSGHEKQRPASRRRRRGHHGVRCGDREGYGNV